AEFVRVERAQDIYTGELRAVFVGLPADEGKDAVRRKDEDATLAIYDPVGDRPAEPQPTFAFAFVPHELDLGEVRRVDDGWRARVAEMFILRRRCGAGIEVGQHRTSAAVICWPPAPAQAGASPAARCRRPDRMSKTSRQARPRPAGRRAGRRRGRQAWRI